MFTYLKYPPSIFFKPKKQTDGTVKGLDLITDRASTISLSTTSDQFEINEYCLCGSFKVLKVLPIIAAVSLLFEVAFAIVIAQSRISDAFVPSTLCTIVILFATFKGVRKEHIKMVKFALYLLISELLYIGALLATTSICLIRSEMLLEKLKFTLPKSLYLPIFIILGLHFINLILQMYLTIRAVNIIRKRDLIYVIPSAKTSVHMRPSMIMIIEKLKNQNLGVQAF